MRISWFSLSSHQPSAFRTPILSFALVTPERFEHDTTVLYDRFAAFTTIPPHMSLGISPSAGNSFSPPHSAGSLPRGGGILLKSPEDAAAAARNRRISEPGSPIRIEPPSGPSSPLEEKLSSPLETGGSVTGSGTTPRIRFAPLPDSTRPRSTSAGNESTWNPDAGGGGEDGHHQQTVVVNYDNAVESEDDDDDDETREKRGRRWSKSMSMGMGSVDWGSSWKGTKKVLTLGLIGDEDEEGYSNGAPLKKSVSTGGMMGAYVLLVSRRTGNTRGDRKLTVLYSSPFRWTAETERKKTMLGSSPGASSSLLSPRDTGAAASHRRSSSIETSASQLGSSPAKPMKLLNGRVYGGRRASEAAAAEKKRREQDEPEFVEWGTGKSGSGIGSNQPARSTSSTGGGILGGGDDDDGSGMEWVRKRRLRREQEEREKQEREAQQQQPEGGSASGSGSDDSPALTLNTDQASSQSPGSSRSPTTPALHLSDLPPTPIIHVSEHLTPSVSAPSHPGGPLTPIAEIKGDSKPATPIGIRSGLRMAEHDVFGEDDDEENEEARKRNRRRRASSNDGDSDQDEDEEEDEEDDGDFSEDEEEEEEFR